MMSSIKFGRNDTFNVQYDETDMCQVEEDSWVTDILGSEDEIIDDILAHLE
jgi:hypothetical protein